MLYRKFVLLFAFSILFFAAAPAVLADSFSAVIVYGDSLSDDGHLHPGSPPPPYAGGRRSNGPVAVEQLATKLGAPLYDFAIAGATSGVGNYGDGGTQTTLGAAQLPGMLTELAVFTPMLNPALFSTSLFVVWGGANDYLINGSVTTAVTDVDSIVTKLQSLGAKHILVPGMPDLGLTPDYLGSADATAYSKQFNAFLQTSLPTGATYVDTFNLLHSITANPSAYGLSDVTDPCLNIAKGTVCSNPDQYLFWDGFHPTTAAANIVMNQFAAAATPEPSAWVLLSTGLTCCGALVRRRRLAKV